MLVKELISVTAAEALYCPDNKLSQKISFAAACDIMSDILSREAVPDILITHMSSVQTMRTANVFGIKLVLFVRKNSQAIDKKIIELAADMDMVLLCTEKGLFETCGLLYQHDIRPLKQ